MYRSSRGTPESRRTQCHDGRNLSERLRIRRAGPLAPQNVPSPPLSYRCPSAPAPRRAHEHNRAAIWLRLRLTRLLPPPWRARKSVVLGKRVSVRVALGGRRIIKNKKTATY